MKKVLKVLAVLAAVVVVVIIGGIIYFNSTYPNIDPPADVKVSVTAERIERGKYIAHHVALCMDCHSERDWTKFAGPYKKGTEAMGGDLFSEDMGLPGNIYARNITPAGVGSWTDGELIRAITCGVSKDNSALFPIMPYMNYQNMSQEDLYSVVAYLRTLKPIENKVPQTTLNFPLNYIVKTFPPKNYTPKSPVDKSNIKEYGKYLVTMASCNDCHTPAVEGEPLPGKDFAGGQEFNTPFGTLRSANLTPEKETGLGSWTKEQFIARFKTYAPDSMHSIPVKPGEFNTIMPWTMYAGMTEEDLGAIYEYLQTLKPIYNRVEKYTLAKK